MSVQVRSLYPQSILTLSAGRVKGTDTSGVATSGDGRCHRCRETITLYIVGDDYCQQCKREIATRERQDAARKVVRFRAKDLSPWGGAA